MRAPGFSLSILFVLLSGLSCACSKSKPLPPGNWQGRCAPNTDPAIAEHYGPPPTRYVDDRAKIFRAPFAVELEQMLSAFQLETCHQLQVISVTSLEGSTLEKYALDYANRVGLGYRGLNNGVMLILVPKTNQVRIQIGCGLEDVISDAQASDIMQRDLLPSMREGENEAAVRAGVRTLTQLASTKRIESEYRPAGCRR
jgi:uncharacterized protein